MYLNSEEKEKIKVIKKVVKALPKNFVPTIPPNYLFGNPGRRVTVVNTNPNNLLEEYEKKLTIEDYQVLLKFLKDKRSRQKIEITEELTKEKIIKMKQEEDLREKEKYTELERLYRGIL